MSEALEKAKEEAIIAVENLKRVELECLQSISDCKTQIIACQKELDNVRKAIYNWAIVLTNSNIDYTVLCDYIGKSMRVIDNYLDKEDLSRN